MIVASLREPSSKRSGALLELLAARPNSGRHSRRAQLLKTAVLMGVLLRFGAVDLSAQTPDQDVAGLRTEVVELRREVESLRRELREVRAVALPGLPAPAAKEKVPEADGGRQAEPEEDGGGDAVAMLQTQVADLAQTKIESNSKLPVRFSGLILSNTYFNTDVPAWIDNPNFDLPSRPTVSPGSFGSTLRQSRIGIAVDGPAIGSMKSSGYISMDFYGGLVNYPTGQVMGIPRMLYGYLRLDGARTAIEIGEDQMILAPKNPTSLASLYFPNLFQSGNLYLRVPQIRVERTFTDGGSGDFQFTGGILAPVAGDFRSDAFVFITPSLAGDRSKRPALQARLAWRRGADQPVGWEIGVSGHDSRARANPLVTSVSQAGALDMDLHAGRVGFGAEWFVGRNVDAFGGGMGQPGRAYGGFLEGRLKAARKLDFNAGFGLDRLYGRENLSPFLRANTTWYGNWIYQFTPEFLMSFEYRWTSTRFGFGGIGRNNHLNLAFGYSF